jgi:hypothetical protein
MMIRNTEIERGKFGVDIGISDWIYANKRKRITGSAQMIMRRTSKLLPAFPSSSICSEVANISQLPLSHHRKSVDAGSPLRPSQRLEVSTHARASEPLSESSAAEPSA